MGDDYKVNIQPSKNLDQANSKNYVYKTYGVPAVTFELGDETDRAAYPQDCQGKRNRHDGNPARDRCAEVTEFFLCYEFSLPGWRFRFWQHPVQRFYLRKAQASGSIFLLKMDGFLMERVRPNARLILVYTTAELSLSEMPMLPSCRQRTVLTRPGHIVAPGFIDPHTHADGDLKSDDIERRRNLPFAYQGVTTVVVGNDGNGNSNIAKMAMPMRAAKVWEQISHIWRDLAICEKRFWVMPIVPPSPKELAKMKAMMTGAMCEGAFGFSAGLYYTPQNFASTEEVIELAKIAAQYGGYYDTHLRDESTYNIGLSGAVNEALEIGRNQAHRFISPISRHWVQRSGDIVQRSSPVWSRRAHRVSE